LILQNGKLNNTFFPSPPRVRTKVATSRRTLQEDMMMMPARCVYASRHTNRQPVTVEGSSEDLGKQTPKPDGSDLWRGRSRVRVQHASRRNRPGLARGDSPAGRGGGRLRRGQRTGTSSSVCDGAGCDDVCPVLSYSTGLISTVLPLIIHITDSIFCTVAHSWKHARPPERMFLLPTVSYHAPT
jgi:hypothetical protein